MFSLFFLPCSVDHIFLPFIFNLTVLINFLQLIKKHNSSIHWFFEDWLNCNILYDLCYTVSFFHNCCLQLYFPQLLCLLKADPFSISLVSRFTPSIAVVCPGFGSLSARSNTVSLARKCTRSKVKTKSVPLCKIAYWGCQA